MLVKASGDPRLKDDPRTAPLADRAADFVACFAYADQMADVPLHDEQGTYDRPYKLTVTFDPGKIDAVLATLGEKPWRGERPVVVPVLLVRGPRPPPYVLSAEAPAGAEQRGAFATAAGEFGLKFRALRATRNWPAGASPPTISRRRPHPPPPARQSSSARSIGTRRCPAGSAPGACAGTAATTNGECAGSITTPRSATSSAAPS